MAIETEQIVVEFVGDTSALEPAIDQLEKVGAIDKAIVEQFKKANAEFAVRRTALNELAKSNAGVAEANSKTIAGYDELSDKLGSLSSQIENGAIGQAAQGFAEGFHEALGEAGLDVNQFRELITKAGADTNVSNTGVRKTLQDLRKDYRALVSDAIAAGGSQTQAGKEILKQAGAVKDEIEDLQAATRAFGSDTRTFDGITQGLNGVAAGFQTAQGLQALLGDESDDYQKTLVRLQGVMAVTNGLQQAQALFQKESSFSLNVLNPLQRAYTTYIGESTGALKLFKNAFLAIGIGAIVIAIVALVQNWEKLSDAISGTTESQRQLNALRVDAAKQAAEERTSVELLVDEYKNANTAQSRRKEIIEELKETSPAYFGQLNTEKTTVDQLTGAYEKYADALVLKATAEGAAKKIAENNIKIAELQNEAVTEQVSNLETAVNAILSFGNAGDFASRQITKGFENQKESIKDLQKSNESLKESLIASRKELDNLGGDPGKDTDKGKDPAKAIKKAKTDYEVAIAGIEKSTAQYKSLISELGTDDPDVKYVLFQTNIDEIKAKISVATQELEKSLPPEQKVKIQGDLTNFTEQLTKAKGDLNQFLNEFTESGNKQTQKNFDDTLSASEFTFQKQRESAAANAKTQEDLERQLTRIKENELNERLALYKLYGKDTTDIERAISEFNQEQSNARIQQTADETAARKELEKQVSDFTLEALQRTVDLGFQIYSNNIQEETTTKLTKLEKEKKKELENTKLTADEKKKIEESYDQRVRTIKREAAKQQRDADLIQAGVNGFLAVTKALAENGNLATQAIAVSNAIFTTALQVAAISATPLPQFRYGIERIEGKGTSTSDSVVARLSVGERVVDATKNRKYGPALSAIHNDKVSPEVANYLLAGAPIKDPLPQKVVLDSITVNSDGVVFDEERFARKVVSLMYPALEDLSRENRRMLDQSNEALAKSISNVFKDFKIDLRR